MTSPREKEKINRWIAKQLIDMANWLYKKPKKTRMFHKFAHPWELVLEEGKPIDYGIGERRIK